MTATTTSHSLPMILERVRVEKVTRLSPSFVRFELGHPVLADFGGDGPTYDQRIKLIFPHEDNPLPVVEGADDSWYGTWLARPLAERGHMRTYTVRDLVGEGEATRLLVDIVLHGAGEGDGHAEAGPGSTWAARAEVGTEVILMGPRRGEEYGGIEWLPGDAEHLLLVADETAVPAVAAILEQLADAGSTARGAAYLEVPHVDDVQDLRAPASVAVTWVVRDAAGHGERVHAACVEHLGGGSARVVVADEEVDPDLWETPVWSSSGEQVTPLEEAHAHDGDLSGLYAWIAGESKLVTGLRRVLVKELDVDRSQVAFMGYWRHGVAMKS